MYLNFKKDSRFHDRIGTIKILRIQKAHIYRVKTIEFSYLADCFVVFVHMRPPFFIIVDNVHLIIYAV